MQIEMHPWQLAPCPLRHCLLSNHLLKRTQTTPWLGVFSDEHIKMSTSASGMPWACVKFTWHRCCMRVFMAMCLQTWVCSFPSVCTYYRKSAQEHRTTIWPHFFLVLSVHAQQIDSLRVSSTWRNGTQRRQESMHWHRGAQRQGQLRFCVHLSEKADSLRSQDFEVRGQTWILRCEVVEGGR